MTPAAFDIDDSLDTYLLVPSVDSRRMVDQEVYEVIQGVKCRITLREVYL